MVSVHSLINFVILGYPLLFLFFCIQISATIAYNIPSSAQQQTTSLINRRTFHRVAAFFVTGSIVHFPATAEDEVAAGGIKETTSVTRVQPSIRKYPDLQYLVPIYNLQDALNVLESQLVIDNVSSNNDADNAGNDDSNFSAIERITRIRRASEIVDRFLQGGFLSNKNLFRGLCIIYIGEIKYDTTVSSPDLVAADQNSRLEYCDDIIDGIVKMQKPLKELVKQQAEYPTTEILTYLNQSKSAIGRFLSNVPADDVNKIRIFIQAVGKADIDGNGKLSKTEVETLSFEDQELYKVVGELV